MQANIQKTTAHASVQCDLHSVALSDACVQCDLPILPMTASTPSKTQATDTELSDDAMNTSETYQGNHES